MKMKANNIKRGVSIGALILLILIEAYQWIENGRRDYVGLSLAIMTLVLLVWSIFSEKKAKI
jgi:hypothetical protein